MNKLRVFIDTNVWFSYFYGSKNAEIVINSFVDDKFVAVISKNVLNELVKNVVQKIPKFEQTLLVFFEMSPPEIVKSPSKINEAVKTYVDLKDRHIFQACIDSKCTIFVTGNLKDFDVDAIYKRYKIQVLSPKQAAAALDPD